MQARAKSANSSVGRRCTCTSCPRARAPKPNGGWDGPSSAVEPNPTGLNGRGSPPTSRRRLVQSHAAAAIHDIT